MSTSKKLASKSSVLSLKKSSKAKPSTTSISLKLDVRIVPSDSNTILGGVRYSIRKYNILFPLIDHEQATLLIKRHICTIEPSMFIILTMILNYVSPKL